MDTVLIIGQMGNAMMANGKMENSMEKEDIPIKKGKVKMEYGKMENV